MEAFVTTRDQNLISWGEIGFFLGDIMAYALQAYIDCEVTFVRVHELSNWLKCL